MKYLDFCERNIVPVVIVILAISLLCFLSFIAQLPTRWNWAVVDGELCFTISDSEIDYGAFNSEGLYCKVKGIRNE